MISVAALTATALTGGHAFPKLSPLTSPMRIHSTFQDGGAGAKLALDRLDASAKDCAAAVQGSGCRSRGGNIKMQAVAAGAATMSVAQACAFMQDPSLSGMTVDQHGQSAPFGSGSSSAPAPPQGAPGGSGQPGTPRARRSHWAPRRCLGCSSEPPPKGPPISPPLSPARFHAF